MGFTVFGIVFLILVLVTLLASVKSAPQGSGWTQERSGRFQRTLKPGLNLIIPYVGSLQAIASAPNQKVLFMPLEASSVIGAISELAREAFGRKD
ncbi:hypothetical protein [Deinococcus maricopensis]|uniref:Band 7 protein n=1 Tax=Deinococcus maricopensis (strain DSM 21211 / LMG 22137 / NRRL B-23946 / LB-34) TaxID=709986 RepID=E8U6R6_DEIML|nr:hypothetical protein [Deinococcus maricopensis]ADV66755.1 hypothetical protein Deima_1102 [Deinococcus maricopensis DSM 21211]